MLAPHLTFFCELEAHALAALFHDPRVAQRLQELKAGVSLGLLDLSPERADVTRQLTEAGIPVTAWLLLPRDEGYYFYLDNAPEAAARYAAFKEWTAAEGLTWAGVGIDIEPDLREMQSLLSRPWNLLGLWLRRVANSSRLRQGLARYSDLVAQMRADGYTVESYQFPLIVDERRAGSTLLQRATGVMDLRVDREVLMLYTSLLPGRAATLWSYGVDAQALGVGSTGGGVDALPKLSWEELERDLLLARCWTDRIYIFSLEGCVQAGFLARLLEMDWNRPVPAPFGAAGWVDRQRALLRTILWTSAHPAALLALPAAALAVAALGRKRRTP